MIQEFRNTHVVTLAREFSQSLLDVLGPTILAEIVTQNNRSAFQEGRPHICHTHDHLDSNETMAYAFEKVIGRAAILPCDVEKACCELTRAKLDKQETADIALITSAWNYAKSADFFIQESEVTADPPDTLATTCVFCDADGTPELDHNQSGTALHNFGVSRLRMLRQVVRGSIQSLPVIFSVQWINPGINPARSLSAVRCLCGSLSLRSHSEEVTSSLRLDLYSIST